MYIYIYIYIYIYKVVDIMPGHTFYYPLALYSALVSALRDTIFDM